MITCDPNLRLNLWKSAEEAKEQMEWALRQADVVKISDEEIEFLWGMTPEAGTQKLLNAQKTMAASVRIRMTQRAVTIPPAIRRRNSDGAEVF